MQINDYPGRQWRLVSPSWNLPERSPLDLVCNTFLIHPTLSMSSDSAQGRFVTRSSECLANTHAPSPTIPSPGEVSAKIDAVFLTQFISWPSPHIGQEVIVSEEYLTRDHSAEAPQMRRSRSPSVELGDTPVVSRACSGRSTCRLYNRAVRFASLRRVPPRLNFAMQAAWPIPQRIV